MLLIHRDERASSRSPSPVRCWSTPRSEAREALALLETCPVLDRAKVSVPNVPVQLRRSVRRQSRAIYPDEHRWVTDNMWTHAPVDELLPGLRRIAETLPGGARRTCSG